MRISSRIAVLLVLLVPLLLRLPLSAAEPATEPAPADTAAAQSAELRLLRAQVKQLQSELAALKTQNAALKARLLAVNVDPDPATQPTASSSAKPRRVVFIADYTTFGSAGDIHEQIRQAIGQLTDDQWFNVVVSDPRTARPFSKLMVQATPVNREKAIAFLPDARAFLYGNPAMTLPAALQLRPEAIYFFGTGVSSDTLADLKKRNDAGIHARFYTTTAFTPPGYPAMLHALWQLAHDSGGVCIDAKGNPIDEPVIPVTIERPQPKPATKPSIFKLNP